MLLKILDMYSAFFVYSFVLCMLSNNWSLPHCLFWGGGGAVIAGCANDARCVCDLEALQGSRVQVKTPSGSVPLGPVTKKHSPQPHMHPPLPPCVRAEGENKNHPHCSRYCEVTKSSRKQLKWNLLKSIKKALKSTSSLKQLSAKAAQSHFSETAPASRITCLLLLKLVCLFRSSLSVANRWHYLHPR